MRVSDAFPSKYIAATDLDGKNLRVVISSVEIEKLGDDAKPIVYFQHQKKGMVLNKTNARKIADTYGDDMDDWIGRELILFPAMVDFKGDTVEAIRVRAPQAKDRTPTGDRITTAPQRMQANEPPPWEPEN